ncbi:MAG: septum formation protein Maf [Planctomycetes bacterium]|nr:septum formation protein Maf [Planctomycetota bacterium]
MSQLVLASTSPYRQKLLERLGLAFACCAPGIDEAAVKQGIAEPEALARELARQKAMAGLRENPGAFVIGSDQVATIDGIVLDKPGTAERAAAQLATLQGREHRLITAVAIAHDGGVVEFVDVTRLCMRPLEPAEIDRYLAAEQPLDCAGSYRIEGLGIALFAGIDGEDQTAIIGLPLLRLAAELRQLGFAVP